MTEILLPKIICHTAIAAAAFLTMTVTAHAVPAIGLTNGTALFRFDTTTPGIDSAATTITGLSAGDRVLGLDYRPTTSILYGLSSGGRLYTINAATGAATLASTVSTSLLGTDFDISFNPTVDRLRIVGASGQDLRVNVDTGAATIDGTIAFAAGDANAGRIPAVSAVGYTNQSAGTVTTTTLYDLDLASGVLTTQNPPNNGTLNTIGALGVAGLTSFDIDPSTGIAYASSSSGFYRVNLATGAASLIGGFGTTGVSDFALVPTPEPMSLALLGTGVLGLAWSRRSRAV